MAGFSKHELQEIVLQSFKDEINALKPGNVSRYSEGHGMTYEDFIQSAELVTPILCDSSLEIGQRILNSVLITMQEVGCNTNLGMLLLFTPVIMAYESELISDTEILRKKISDIINNITIEQSKPVYLAIKTAAPGGLGHTDKFDVELQPECTLFTAMQHAEAHDFIAKQYVTGYAEILTTGVSSIKEFTSRWNSVEWATVGCYLTILSRHNDTHIERKFSTEVAAGIKQKAIKMANMFRKKTDPEDAKTALLDFDRELKNRFINPGTSADLTAASLLISSLMSQTELRSH